jgi:plastocyanin
MLITAALFFNQSTFAKTITFNVINNDGQPLSGVVVYVTPKAPDVELPVNSSRLVIGQKNREFSPYISVVQKGQLVDFENNDDITHHIYSVSGKNTFDFKIKAGNRLKVDQFKASEEVAMGCNIHDWMSGYLLVVDTPYYGLTNSAGNITLDLVYKGDYSVKVWHPQLDTASNQFEQLVNVGAKSLVEHQVKVPAILLELPSQKSTDDFEFLEEY